MHQSRWYRTGGFDDPRPSGAERFLAKVAKSADAEGCWLWTKKVGWQGYGVARVNGRTVSAHRGAYELFVGPVPVGLVLDHLCRNRLCVRPDHLEPVTNAENIRRGQGGQHQRTKPYCPQGHLYDEANTHTNAKGHRYCRSCRRESSRRRYQRSKQAKQPTSVALERPVRNRLADLLCEACTDSLVGQVPPELLRELTRRLEGRKT